MSRWDEGVTWHLELVTPPAVEPVSLEFVRDDYLRSPNQDAEDKYIATLIKTTRRAAERYTRRALIQQDWDLVLDRFPCHGIVLPRPPLIDVIDITYLDENGAEQTWAPSAYKVSRPVGPNAQKARIQPVYNTFWPTTRVEMDAVRVTFRAGYVKNTSPLEPDVPQDIIEGMLRMMGELYKHRSETYPMVAGQVAPAIIRAHDLWLPYRVS